MVPENGERSAVDGEDAGVVGVDDDVHGAVPGQIHQHWGRHDALQPVCVDGPGLHRRTVTH